MADKLLDNPANADLIAFLSRKTGSLPQPASGPPGELATPRWEPGVRPESVESIWDMINHNLPSDCRWIFGGTPVLAHPETGMVFTVAVGSHIYALRLPSGAREQALHAGAQLIYRYSDSSTLDIEDLGEDWVIGPSRWSFDEEMAWFRQAYAYASENEGQWGTRGTWNVQKGKQ